MNDIGRRTTVPAQRDLSKPIKARIAVVVPNPCDPDFRVIKQAEFLARRGCAVQIFCTHAPHLPIEEHLNGVTYRRIEWHVAKSIRRRIGLRGASPTATAEERKAAPGGEVDSLEAAIAGERKPNYPAEIARRLVRPLVFARSRLLSFLVKRLYRPLTFMTFDMAFREAIEAWSPDAIHAHDLIALPAAMRAARGRNIPVVFDSHELEEHRNPPLSPLERRLVRRIERRYLRQCAAVTTVSEPIAEYLEVHHRIARPALIYNSPSIGRRRVSDRWIGGTTLKADAGLPDNAFVIVYVGNLALNRGVEVAMAALPHLPPEICLVTVGRMTEQFRATVTELQAELGIAERVRLLRPVGPADVVDYVSDADASIIPVLPATLSYEFAMPNKLFESAFAGLPIIASDIREISRFVRGNGLGVVYSPYDARDCADKILELYNRYDCYKPGIDKVKALQKQYAWEAQEEKLDRIFSKVLEQGTT